MTGKLSRIKFRKNTGEKITEKSSRKLFRKNTRGKLREKHRKKFHKNTGGGLRKNHHGNYSVKTRGGNYDTVLINVARERRRLGTPRQIRKIPPNPPNQPNPPNPTSLQLVFCTLLKINRFFYGKSSGSKITGTFWGFRKFTET